MIYVSNKLLHSDLHEKQSNLGYIKKIIICFSMINKSIQVIRSL